MLLLRIDNSQDNCLVRTKELYWSGQIENQVLPGI